MMSTFLTFSVSGFPHECLSYDFPELPESDYSRPSLYLLSSLLEAMNFSYSRRHPSTPRFSFSFIFIG